MGIRIDSAFDGGNIIVIDANDPADIRLEIAKDNQSDFYQWFFFRVTGARNIQCTFRIMNAAGVAYPGGFEDYQAVISDDLDDWFRTDTQFNDGVLSISATPQTDSFYVAYFAPYSDQRHKELVAAAQCEDGVSHIVPGETLDGRPLDVLRFSPLSIDDHESAARPVIWVTARQHPGETMAQWWMEGFIGRLIDMNDPASRALRRRADLFVVPNMNPDGSVRGHLRTNAAGVNLNREWHEPTLERSPEVYLVRGMMDDTGVTIALDVHGDEALPYNFIAGAEGTPNFSDTDEARLEAFKSSLARLSPDFQTRYGYPKTPAGKADLSICTNAMFHRFGCLAMTLEMPFKDTADTPMPQTGWSPARSRHLGASCVNALLEAL